MGFFDKLTKKSQSDDDEIVVRDNLFEDEENANSHTVRSQTTVRQILVNEPPVKEEDGEEEEQEQEEGSVLKEIVEKKGLSLGSKIGLGAVGLGAVALYTFFTSGSDSESVVTNVPQQQEITQSSTSTEEGFEGVTKAQNVSNEMGGLTQPTESPTSQNSNSVDLFAQEANKFNENKEKEKEALLQLEQEKAKIEAEKIRLEQEKLAIEKAKLEQATANVSANASGEVKELTSQIYSALQQVADRQAKGEQVISQEVVKVVEQQRGLNQSLKEEMDKNAVLTQKVEALEKLISSLQEETKLLAAKTCSCEGAAKVEKQVAATSASKPVQKNYVNVVQSQPSKAKAPKVIPVEGSVGEYKVLSVGSNGEFAWVQNPSKKGVIVQLGDTFMGKVVGSISKDQGIVSEQGEVILSMP